MRRSRGGIAWLRRRLELHSVARRKSGARDVGSAPPSALSLCEREGRVRESVRGEREEERESEMLSLFVGVERM